MREGPYPALWDEATHYQGEKLLPPRLLSLGGNKITNDETACETYICVVPPAQYLITSTLVKTGIGGRLA